MVTGKTSLSHPLKINYVSLDKGGGKIGLTFCPGKKHYGAHSGTWDRDVGLDFEQIVGFGAKALVTLMENHELESVNAPASVIGEYAKSAGIEWHHLPIKDVDVPDETFEELWTYSGLRLRTILANGGNVVIHCLGGLGRTGTIAARLLVEFGDEPEVAIQKVREARPGSIETAAQAKYVKKCGPIRAARMIRSPEERALACLLGGAIGDGFGYEVEFSNLGEIRERFGHGGINAPVLHKRKLVVSDDTQMTLFTLEGILASLRNGEGWIETCIPSIRNAYLDWYETQREGKSSPRSNSGWLIQQPEMRVRRAPGNTCMGALHSGGHGAIDDPINNSKGCGGAMRTAPVGLIPFLDVATVFRLAAQAAALTHGHPSGYLSAAMVAALVHLLMNGTSLTADPGTGGALDQCRRILQSYPGHDETRSVVERAVQLAAMGLKDHAKDVETLGGGWVGEEALAIAIYAVLSAESFVEAISIAANHSGDSDSTASIAGQLWGAANGLAGMPHEWVSRVDILGPMLHLARQLVARCYRDRH